MCAQLHDAGMLLVLPHVLDPETPPTWATTCALHVLLNTLDAVPHAADLWQLPEDAAWMLIASPKEAPPVGAMPQDGSTVGGILHAQVAVVGDCCQDERKGVQDAESSAGNIPSRGDEAN